MSEIVLTDATGAIKPRNAQMGTKIYFWHNPRTGHIYQGAPPQYDAMRPQGYETITCNHPWEAEKWSARLNEQDNREQAFNDEEREMVEGARRVDLRKEILELKRNPPDYIDGRHKRARDMLLDMALGQLDEHEERRITKRESFLHLEAFEAGKG